MWYSVHHSYFKFILLYGILTRTSFIFSRYRYIIIKLDVARAAHSPAVNDLLADTYASSVDHHTRLGDADAGGLRQRSAAKSATDTRSTLRRARSMGGARLGERADYASVPPDDRAAAFASTKPHLGGGSRQLRRAGTAFSVDANAAAAAAAAMFSSSSSTTPPNGGGGKKEKQKMFSFASAAALSTGAKRARKRLVGAKHHGTPLVGEAIISRGDQRDMIPLIVHTMQAGGSAVPWDGMYQIDMENHATAVDSASAVDAAAAAAAAATEADDGKKKRKKKKKQKRGTVPTILRQNVRGANEPRHEIVLVDGAFGDGDIHEGGVETIQKSHRWILRRIGGGNPTLWRAPWTEVDRDSAPITQRMGTWVAVAPLASGAERSELTVDAAQSLFIASCVVMPRSGSGGGISAKAPKMSVMCYCTLPTRGAPRLAFSAVDDAAGSFDGGAVRSIMEKIVLRLQNAMPSSARSFSWDWEKWCKGSSVVLNEEVEVALDPKAASSADGVALPTSLPYFAAGAPHLVIHTKGPSAHPRLSFKPAGSSQLLSVEKLKITVNPEGVVIAQVASKYSSTASAKSKLTVWSNQESPDGDGNAVQNNVDDTVATAGKKEDNVAGRRKGGSGLSILSDLQAESDAVSEPLSPQSLKDSRALRRQASIRNVKSRLTTMRRIR